MTKNRRSEIHEAEIRRFKSAMKEAGLSLTEAKVRIRWASFYESIIWINGDMGYRIGEDVMNPGTVIFPQNVGAAVAYAQAGTTN